MRVHTRLCVALAILLTSLFATPALAQDSLTANPWQWISFTSPVEQFDVETPASYLLTFNADGTVSIVADCNNAAGSYTDDAGALSIAVGPMTMAACPEGSRSDQFVVLLGGAARYFFQDGGLYIDLFADGGTLAFAPAAAAPAAEDGAYLCSKGESADDCAAGAQTIVGEATSARVDFLPDLYPNPSALLIDMSNILSGKPELFVPETGQILGILTEPLFPGPGQFRINLPIRPSGVALDLDNNGEEDAGVQVYGLAVASSMINDSYLQQLDQVTGPRSYLQDVSTGAVTEGTFVVYAPDDKQGFPTAIGADGLWFTADDPTSTLPAGYTVATLAADGTVSLDRSPEVTINTVERAEEATLDFSEQGILVSFNSLIDALNDRYAYTAQRGLDWEAIRQQYLPAVTQADADNDMTAYFVILSELARSLNDSHVSASTGSVPASTAWSEATTGQLAANVGATTVAVSDESGAISERVLVVTVGEGSPAAEVGLVPGAEIVSVDGTPTAERLDQIPLTSGLGTPEVRRATQARSLLNFPPGQSVTVGYRLPDSSEVLSATLEAGAYETGQVLPPSVTATSISYEQRGDYALLQWRNFVDNLLPKIAVLEEALGTERDRESGGVILDLRGNDGGWVPLYETMVSYFFTTDDPMKEHVFDTDRYDAAADDHVLVAAVDYMLSAPRPELSYTGPVVILVDEGCASSCEYFSQHMQVLGRAQVVGQYPTKGAGGSIDRIAMPGQTTFTYTAAGSYFAGTDEPNLEAKGVVPDIRVPVSVETEQAKMRGEDPVMEAAIAALDAQADRLTATPWQWIALLDASQQIVATENPTDYTVSFGEDGTVTVNADCNQANGTYTRGDVALTITLDATTTAVCGADSRSEEFLGYLGAVANIGFDGENLALLMNPESGVIGIELAPAK